jgi:hypothetical protein
LLTGHTVFKWQDHDAVGDVLQPAFRREGKGIDGRLVNPYDLPSADRAAYEALMAMWRENAQRRAKEQQQQDATAAADGLDVAEDTVGEPAAHRGPRGEGAVAAAATVAGQSAAPTARVTSSSSNFLLRAQRALQAAQQ